MYAQLALKIPVSAIEVNFTGPAGGQPFKDSQSSKQVNTGAIVGAVFGGLAILIALGLIAWFLRRRQQHPRVIEIPSEDMLESAGARKHQTLTPFRLGDDQSQRSDELLPNPFGESEMSHTTYSEARGSDSDQPFLPQTASDAATLTRVPFAPPLVPTGLSDKALARLRMENSSMSTASSRAHLWNVSDSSGGVSPESSLGEPLPVASGSGARPLPPPPIPPTPLALSAADTTSDLRVEVEYLRREMQQIREERLEPPPMYYAGDSAAPSQ
ncbi:hypothetical protein FA95DRAFT_854703 [Auriscalpium vulgare]|uniref:Uncharacterized protein n=1 Tax=Auriscalpium vulgare TaxID=40419 RepID=A0ACB8S0Y7_9AGAM|nr:hypothetical protein FA95DRAFT_854703 [Auriscalpium vulgare]